jgi:hypothetical protein
VRLRLEEEARTARQVSTEKALLEGARLGAVESTANAETYGFFSEDKTAVRLGGSAARSRT